MAWEDYGPNWDDLSRQTYARDNYTCQGCGATGVILNAHHKTPRSKGGPDTLDNLISYCNACHEVPHPHLRRQRESREAAQEHFPVPYISDAVKLVFKKCFPRLGRMFFGDSRKI
jgi:hypothetical protein